MGIGAVNGFFVTRLKDPSFLVTLGMLLVVRPARRLWAGRAAFRSGPGTRAKFSQVGGPPGGGMVLVGSFCIGGDGDFLHRRAAQIYMSLILVQ